MAPLRSLGGPPAPGALASPLTGQPADRPGYMIGVAFPPLLRKSDADFLLVTARQADGQRRASAKGLPSSNGPTMASALGRPRTSAATARTSSWLTASMAASVSSTGSSLG